MIIFLIDLLGMLLEMEKFRLLHYLDESSYALTGGPTYTGIPCRHLIAVATKEEKVSFSALSFNRRWKKEYYNQGNNEAEPERANGGEKEEQQKEI